MANMLGKAMNQELTDLYFNLSVKSTEEREKIPFALFVIGRGMLNGEEAFLYLRDRLKEGTN